MQIVSFYDEIAYHENKPALKVLLNTAAIKEVRIAFKTQQEMKAHKAPYPIIIQIIEGSIDFGIENEGRKMMSKGMMIALEANIVHDLIATADSLVRLSIHKADHIGRVQAAAEQ